MEPLTKAVICVVSALVSSLRVVAGLQTAFLSSNSKFVIKSFLPSILTWLSASLKVQKQEMSFQLLLEVVALFFSLGCLLNRSVPPLVCLLFHQLRCRCLILYFDSLFNLFLVCPSVTTPIRGTWTTYFF